MSACCCMNDCCMEGKRAIRLLETAAFCTGVPGTQAHSGGLKVPFENVGWSLLRAKAHRSLLYQDVAHSIDIHNIPQGRPVSK